MIQRIQTVYLLLGALLLGAFFSFPTIWHTWIGAVHGALPWALAVWGAVTAGTAIVSIFMYGERRRQRKTVVVVQWLTIVFIAALYSLLVAVDRWAVVFRGDVATSYLVAVLLPVAAYIVFYMARRGIDHDIEKIRSVDRLR